jgi:SulP family sulfate permease
MPCLAGVLIMVAYNMSGWRTIRSMCRQSRSDIAILFTTMLLTIIFDLTIAIEVGLVLAVILFVRRIMETSKISILRDEMDVHHDGEDGEVHLAIPKGVEVYEINGPLFFGIATKFEELASKRDVMPIRIVRMRKVSFIDSTGLHNLEIFIESALKSGQQVILSGVNRRVYKALESAGIIRVLGDENVLDHIDLALARAEQLSKELEK